MQQNLVRKPSLALLVATAVAAIGVSGSAFAVTSTRTQVQNGAGVCQSALPVFDGNIRKRPMAIGNEGSSSAFVSCSLESQDYSNSLNTYSGVGLSNRGSAAATVACTMVTGITGVVATSYFSKSISIPAGGFVVLSWSPTVDNGGTNFDNNLNFSCQLPVGTDVNFVFTNIDEQVGA